MKKKYYHILKAFLSGACALFFLSLPLWEPGAKGFEFLVATGFVYWTVRNLKQIKESKNGDQVYAPDSEDSIPEQIVNYKIFTYISLIGFPILSIVAFLDLNDLISGTKESYEISAPVPFIYEQLGYWPAVFVIPLIGIIITLLGVRKIYILKSSVKNQT